MTMTQRHGTRTVRGSLSVATVGGLARLATSWAMTVLAAV